MILALLVLIACAFAWREIDRFTSKRCLCHLCDSEVSLRERATFVAKRRWCSYHATNGWWHGRCWKHVEKKRAEGSWRERQRA